MSEKKRKILLVVDNCAAHPKIVDLKNINLVFLPPNTAAKLQPMDQGVINSLKFHFRKSLVLHLIHGIEQNIQSSISLLDATRFLDRAWVNVTSTTIRNAFKHAGWLSTDTTIRQEESEVWDWEDELPLSALASVFNTENVNFQEYVGVDDDVWTSGIPNDEDIIDEVYKKHNQTDTTQEYADPNFDDDESGDPPTKVSVPKAKECLLTLRTFFEHVAVVKPEENVFGHLSCLENLVDRSLLAEKKQRKMTDYYFP